MRQMPVGKLLKMLRGRNGPSVLILFALLAVVWWSDERQRDRQPDPHAAARGRYEGVCFRVLDGDTLDVRAESGEEFRLRLLGIDCLETHNEEKLAEQARRLGLPMPEARKLGEIGRDRTRSVVLNKRIEWVVPEGTPLFDPYDRLLAYVEIEGRDLGELLLKDGLAELRREPHPRSSKYRQVAVDVRKTASR